MKTTTKEYFNWLCDIVDDGEHLQSHKNVLAYLFLVPFEPKMPMDDNRADDGINLRYIFADELGYHPSEVMYYLDNQPCSILELMIALARRCEDIMSDYETDRTAYWFWDMFGTMGLMPTRNSTPVEDIFPIVESFNNRTYLPDGTGGLFYVPDFDGDLRTVEIWYQMQLYLKDKN